MIEVIPAIDIIDGKCVRLSQGDFETKKVYSESPLETAKQFEAAGITRLHMVDLDGARQGKLINLASLSDVASNTNLKLDFGGGIKTKEDVLSVLNAGAGMINIGSIAVKQPALVSAWIEEFGSEKILLGADVRDEKIVTHGWQVSTDIGILKFIEDFVRRGIKQIFCTDVAKDGLLEGTSVDLYQKILGKFPVLHLIASGGVTAINDIEALEAISCAGVIIGKALYEGRIRLGELKKFLAHGIN